MRGERVPQRMSREARAVVDLLQKAFHRILNCAHGNALAATAQKKRSAIARLPDPPQELIALRRIVSQRQLGVITNRNDPLLPSLSPHLDLLRQQVDIHAIDAAELREAHAGRIEQLEDRAVSDVGESSLLRLQLR